MKFLFPSSLAILAVLLNQAAAESQVLEMTETFTTEPTLTFTVEPTLYVPGGSFGSNFDRCPSYNSWGGPGDYCVGGRIHWCNNPDDPATGLSNDCGGRGCQANLPGIPDRCNPRGGNIGGGGGSLINGIIGVGGGVDRIIDGIIGDMITDIIGNIGGGVGGGGSIIGNIGGGSIGGGSIIGGIAPSADTYRVNGFEDLCIDITDGRLIAGQAAQIWHCDNQNKNQRFIPFPDGTIRMAADTSLCLDAYSGLSAGTPIQLWQCTGNVNQKWDLRLNLDGTIRPRSRPELCFNIVDGSMQAGERLQLWGCTAASNEQFVNIGNM